MDLILSRDSATNTVISSNNIPLYKIHTPSSLLEWNTTITRIDSDDNGSAATPPGSRPSSIANSNIYSSSFTGSSDRLIPSNTKLEPLIHIRWHLVAATKLRFNGGHEMNLDEYMGTEGFLGRHRTFHGPDGRPYKWTTGLTCSTLKLNDGSKTPIARYHHQQLGIIGKPRKARIEVYKDGLHMVDTIVITFAIVEKMRRDD